jgi:hypothetical protein
MFGIACNTFLEDNMKEYSIIIYLNDDKPLPQLGDRLEIVSFEDHSECRNHRPYIIAILEPVLEPNSDKEIINT